MSRQPLRSVTTPAPNKPASAELDRAATRLLADLLVRLDRGDPDPFPYLRVKDLVAPRGVFSKPWLFARLREGRLRAVKLDGLLLIERASVRELLDSAEPWRPKNGEGAP